MVGENGSGKTTFIKLLCRLYDPTQGEILLNGIDIRKYSYRQYIDLFSVVFQDFQLLAFPLGQNVAAAVEVDKGRPPAAWRWPALGSGWPPCPRAWRRRCTRSLTKAAWQVSGARRRKSPWPAPCTRTPPLWCWNDPPPP